MLKHFGSVRKVREASVEEIAAVPGVGPKLAATILDAVAQSGQNGGINVTTGELLGNAEADERATGLN